MSTDKTQKSVAELIAERVKNNKNNYKLSLSIDKKSIIDARNEILNACKKGKLLEEEQQ